MSSVLRGPTVGEHATDLTWYRAMLRIRKFEEQVLELRRAEEIVGSVHLCNGQEAIYVGATSVLRPTDAVFATYRGHGWAIACGSPLSGLFGELMGRSSGVCGGRGGSAYFSDPDNGFFGENSIVGAGSPIAVGAALAAKFQHADRVSVSAFGEGAMNQGSLHEALNFAAAFDLGVVFVCENNRYSELTPTVKMVRSDRMSDRAAAYGIRGVRVDGNDPAAVASAVGEAVAAAREGGGPTLVEAMTHRIVGHYIGDAEQYRAPGELEEARADEPLARVARLLQDQGAAADREAVDAEVEAEIAEALDAARKAPMADPSTAREGVYV